MTKLAIVVLVVLVNTTFGSASYRGLESSNRAGPLRYPFLPHVVSSTKPDLCQALAEDYRKAFLGNEPDIRIGNRRSKRAAPHPFQALEMEEIPLTIDRKSTDIRKLFVARRDLNGDGELEILARLESYPTWRGDTYDGLVFPSMATLTEALAEAKYAKDIRGHGRIFYPVSGKDGTKSNFFWNDLLEYDGEVYFIDESIDWYSHTVERGVIPVFRVDAMGDTEEVCRVQLQPSIEALRSFKERPGLASYVEVLSRPSNAQPSGGQLPIQSMHYLRRKAGVLEAGFRPWLANEQARNGWERSGIQNPSRELTEKLLHLWGQTDPWSQREYEVWIEHRGAAERAIEHYLVAEFGYSTDEAPELAKNVLAHLTQAAFAPVAYAYAQGRSFDTDIQAIIDGRNPQSISQKLLPFAVDNPLVLESLLQAGLDVDGGNEFGKTALMYAAHLNRPDAVKVLLDHGANPNAATSPVAGWHPLGFALSRTGRTALTYAAENAGIEVMALLLDAGSDPRVVDSKGNALNYYLAENPRFGEEEVGLGLVELVAKHRRAGGPRGPSFPCEKARTRSEKAICGDVVLSLFDKELADAYREWVTMAPDASEEKADQLRWLRTRDSVCSPEEGQQPFIVCLQRKTRARTRYLRNRVGELRPKASARASDDNGREAGVVAERQPGLEQSSAPGAAANASVRGAADRADTSPVPPHAEQMPAPAELPCEYYLRNHSSSTESVVDLNGAPIYNTGFLPLRITRRIKPGKNTLRLPVGSRYKVLQKGVIEVCGDIENDVAISLLEDSEYNVLEFYVDKEKVQKFSVAQDYKKQLRNKLDDLVYMLANKDVNAIMDAYSWDEALEKFYWFPPPNGHLTPEIKEQRKEFLGGRPAHHRTSYERAFQCDRARVRHGKEPVRYDPANGAVVVHATTNSPLLRVSGCGTEIWLWFLVARPEPNGQWQWIFESPQ